MLVLSRKPGEKILVTLPSDPSMLLALAGQEIEITTLKIGPNNVRIGIAAPTVMNIVRTELCAHDAGDFDNA